VNFVNQPGIAVEVEDDRLVLGEERIEVADPKDREVLAVRPQTV